MKNCITVYSVYYTQYIELIKTNCFCTSSQVCSSILEFIRTLTYSIVEFTLEHFGWNTELMGNFDKKIILIESTTLY